MTGGSSSSYVPGALLNYFGRQKHNNEEQQGESCRDEFRRSTVEQYPMNHESPTVHPQIFETHLIQDAPASSLLDHGRYIYSKEENGPSVETTESKLSTLKPDFVMAFDMFQESAYDVKDKIPAEYAVKVVEWYKEDGLRVAKEAMTRGVVIQNLEAKITDLNEQLQKAIAASAIIETREESAEEKERRLQEQEDEAEQKRQDAELELQKLQDTTFPRPDALHISTRKQGNMVSRLSVVIGVRNAERAFLRGDHDTAQMHAMKANDKMKELGIEDADLTVRIAYVLARVAFVKCSWDEAKLWFGKVEESLHSTADQDEYFLKEWKAAVSQKSGCE